MARAMSASGFLKPKAMRVMSRILVLTDSISALDRAWSRLAWIAARCRRILRPSSTNTGIWQRWAQASQAVRACFPSAP